MNKLYDYITSKSEADYYVENTKDQAPYLGEAYFPNKSTTGTATKWLVGAESAPVAVVASNFDTDPLKRDREGFELKKSGLVFFREAIELTEEERVELTNAYKMGANDPVFLERLEKVFDDTTNGIKGARASLEKMRMEVLATGKIGIKENGVDVICDYGLKDTQFLSKTFATPITDLKEARKAYYELNNEYPEDMVISGTLLDSWLETEEVKNLTKNVVFASPTLGFEREDLIALLGSKWQLNVIVNDKKYLTARTKVATKFYPEDRYTLLPHRELGHTILGITPEMLDNEYIDTTVVDDGISISVQETTKSPLKKDTVVSFNALPSFPLANKIVIVKKSN